MPVSGCGGSAQHHALTSGHARESLPGRCFHRDHGGGRRRFHPGVPNQWRLQQRHLRLSRGRQLQFHLCRSAVPCPMRRRQRPLRRRMRQWHLHLWQREQLQFQLQGASLPRELFREHHLHGHLLQWSVRLRRRQHLQFHVRHLALSLHLRPGVAVRGALPARAGRHASLRSGGLRRRCSGGLPGGERDDLRRSLSVKMA